MRNKTAFGSFIVAAVMFACLGSGVRAETLAVKDGEKMAFLGDSITAGGWGSPTGYVRLIVAGLATSGIKVEPIPAGIGGHKSNDMLARLEKDVISKKPDWVTISCGVNDVWHGANGVPLDQYKENMTAIVDQAQAAGIKVMILTATMITEDAANPNNQKLEAYNAFLRTLAAEKKCLLADLNKAMQAALKEGEATGKARGKMLTSDGVHMNPYGDMMMASTVLTAFGLTTEQLTKAQAAWLDIPAGITVTVRQSMSLREYQDLEAKAGKQSVEGMLQGELSQKVQTILKESAK